MQSMLIGVYSSIVEPNMAPGKRADLEANGPNEAKWGLLRTHGY
jgi:hypothetical protein